MLVPRVSIQTAPASYLFPVTAQGFTAQELGAGDFVSCQKHCR